MFRKRWVRRVLAVLGVVLAVVAGITIYNAATGVYGRYNAITSRNSLIAARLLTLAESVRKLDGVAGVTVHYNPEHAPEPAAALTVTMSARATDAEAVVALHRAVSEPPRRFILPRVLTVTVDHGALTIIHTGDATSTGVSRTVVATAAALQVHAGTSLHVDLDQTGTFSRISVSIPAASTSQQRRLINTYASVLGARSAPMTTQWTLPGVVSRSGLPPAAALVLIAAEAEVNPSISAQQSGVALSWNGASPSQSSMCIFAGGPDVDAIADRSLSVFLAHPSTVGNFCILATPTTVVATHQLHFGECDGALSLGSADGEYLAHARSTIATLPAGTVAGRCSATS